MYLPDVTDRLDYYREQAAQALRLAEESTTDHDRATWLGIAMEWQKLYETLTIEMTGETPSKHVLDL